MREYELIFIAKPDLDEKALNELLERVKSWITDGSGEVGKIDLWGKRRLAYPIRKQSEGIYVLMNIAIEPKSGVTLERSLRFTEAVLRFSIIAKN